MKMFLRAGEAEKVLWKTCPHLANNGIKAFPYAGTLLGLVRDGKLLDFDKDLDIAVWMDSWQACCTTLGSAGWVTQTMRIDYLRHLAWKALARGDQLLTKEFRATASGELWLDWNDARAADPEARLASSPTG